MKNTISARVADFLKRYPPFDLLQQDQLLKIAEHVKIIYLDKGKNIFNIGEEGHAEFYVVHKGAVEIKNMQHDTLETIDKCDEGDIFGLRPLFAKENYEINAITEEETILYGIPIDKFKPIVEKNIDIGVYLIETFATNTQTPYSKEQSSKLYSKPSDELFELQPAKYVKNVITAPKGSQIKTVAKLMTKYDVGSVIITENNSPIGIVTDQDFRESVATGNLSISSTVSNIMSSPVICYAKGITIAQAQIALMKHRISHLCITEDGTPNSEVVGVLSEHDIVVTQGNNPSVLMKAIKRANSTKELKNIRKKITYLLKGYIQQNIPLTHISKIIFELNDASIKRVIERCIDKMDSPPPVNFSWMSLGSQGRKEQLLQTDQDNAIIFENVKEENIEEVRSYFLLLAKKINKRLNTIGYEYCPAEMMAKNPKWCLSLNEWKDQFTKWILEPGDDEILLCSIFFDFDISYGELSLTNELSQHIFNQTGNNQIFLSMLAASAIRSASPLGFFRQFLVEQDGQYKDFFDLKKRALMPITDAGRLLILSHKVKNINNTAERFEKMAELEPENKELYLSCSYASKALLKFRTKQGLLHNDSGRYIELPTLSKEEKMKLKRCFKSIKDVQELIKLRYKVSHLI
ncbi:DUF294 nucleotidyltransferase-like domain-containing protein [Abyssalbus ytuae]|uniref:DUF294 nucleotidyltransferase-like domain-containing protein n=1 Tax=Abyssalbus ytuae TaxID=2926907 RepID=A0A9E6ZUV1_9FLAO|nr:DUF294 nucleotidyltransferase-like domain-containing protein [Abyssalbus ytuae]UOB17191.1 DUF294 nucleotidyltransferase-like domain-containing protein [Abyssalbus ytuae]